MAYLRSLHEVIVACDIKRATITKLEDSEPGWIMAKAELVQGVEIDALLRKTYAPGRPDDEAVFLAPYPRAVIGWLATLLTPHILIRAGVSPEDVSIAPLLEMANVARQQIAEAADPTTSKYDLPKRQNTAESGRSSVVLSSSQQSPWTWTDEQSDERDY